MRLLISIPFIIFSSMLFAQSSQDAFQAVNSPYDEQNPVLSPDGLTLFFTVGNHPSNMGGKKDPGDIWFARKEGSQWSSPIHGGSLLNDRSYNAVAGFSTDGQQLFLHGHYTADGTPAKTQGISVSKNNGSAWAKPENITIPYFMNKSGILGGSLSADNSVFIFSAESYGTFGVDDLYVTLKKGSSWTEPRNLGPMINTQFQEMSPSISDDGRTLYFSSNGRKGNGSFDVFSATRLDDTWTNWSVPENLGKAINSEGRELFYRFYPSRGFALFTTTTSSDGYGDVRIYTPQEPVPLPDTTIYASISDSAIENKISTPPVDQSMEKEVSAEKIEPKITDTSGEVKVYGKITNAKTGEVIPAKISFQGPTMESLTAESGDNGYAISIPSSQYSVRIEANGYVSSLENLDINSFDMKDLEMNFKLQPVERGTTVNLRNVLFAQAKTEILPESYPELDLVVRFLKDNPTVKIELMGHTDGRGVQADNVRLSQQRVNKVKAYLVSKGISSRRISGKGFGGSKPIASNDTEESRRMNRRVEFVIKQF